MPSKRGPIAEAVFAAVSDGQWHEREEAIGEAMKRVPPMLALDHSRQAFHKGVRAERVNVVSEAYLIRVGSRRLVGVRMGAWRKAGKIEEQTNEDGVRYVRWVGSDS